MSKMNSIANAGQMTNVGALKLQHVSAQMQAGQAAENQTSGSFSEILSRKATESGTVQFSRHATQRVQERGIEMTESLLDDLNQAVEKAREKGAKDVVVIGQNGAFIVNVPHNVVVTTMTEAEMKENIFTNIDSAVLI